MKTVMMCLLTICLLTFSSCKKEDIGPKLRRLTEEKIRGQWMLDKRIDEVFHPIPVIETTNTYNGGSGDFYFFQSNLKVSINSNVAGNSEEDYGVVNPNQIIIGKEVWRIDKLGENELLLVKDLYNVDRNKRFYTRFYLKK